MFPQPDSLAGLALSSRSQYVLGSFFIPSKGLLKLNKKKNGSYSWHIHFVIWSDKADISFLQDQTYALSNNQYFENGQGINHTFEQLLRLGIKTAWQQIELESGSGGVYHQIETHEAIEEKLLQIQKQRASDDNLIEIYRSVGLEEFESFCAELGIDHEEVLARYKNRSDHNQSEEIRVWLFNFLSDGEPRHASSEIRPAIIEAEVINPDQWTLVRKIATEARLTKTAKHGYWKIKGDSKKH